MKRITITLGDEELKNLQGKSRELGTSIADLVRRGAQQVANPDDASERRISERISAAEERLQARINTLVDAVGQVITVIRQKEVSK